MSERFARAECRVLGHVWVARQFHDQGTHEFLVCERCGFVQEGPTPSRHRAGGGVAVHRRAWNVFRRH
jgi:hypothetical protein